MPASPSISVIVPVYNTEKYLRKCLDSICEQTYRNLEILCVNDGSTDGSAAILEEYATKDSRIKIINQPNAGLAAARNTGLQQATGKWITGVDSDDYLEPDAYEYALNAEAEDVDIICFGTNIIWKDSPPLPHMETFYAICEQGTQEPSSEILASTNDSFCNKLFRRDLIQRTESVFPTGLWYEDSLFWRTTAPYARKITFLPEKKYNYVRHGGSIMSQVFEKSIKTLDRIQIAKRLLQYYDSNPLPSHLQKIILDAYLFCFTCALCDVPKELHPQVWKDMRDIATQHNLIKKWPHRLFFLAPTPLFLCPFVHHTSPNKSSYGLPGFRPLVIQHKNGVRIIRLFGIKLHRSVC